jgi:lipoprotein-anchoring transpeptidase ErfK/SrfK
MTPILFRMLTASLLSAGLPFVTAVLIRVETARAPPEPIHRAAIIDERDALTSAPSAPRPIASTREPDIDAEKREMRRAQRARRQAEAVIAGIAAQSALTKTWQQGKALLVDQAAQQLHVYTAGLEIRVMPISTGERPYYTPPFQGYVGFYAGKIYGYGSWADDAWYLFEARGNIYFHSAPYTLNGDEKIYEGLEQLGVRPSSHGCIRLHPDDARWLTGWDPVGALVVITPLPRP